MSHQLHTVKHIDRYGNILTDYGEIDSFNINQLPSVILVEISLYLSFSNLIQFELCNSFIFSLIRTYGLPYQLKSPEFGKLAKYIKQTKYSKRNFYLHRFRLVTEFQFDVGDVVTIPDKYHIDEEDVKYEFELSRMPIDWTRLTSLTIKNMQYGDCLSDDFTAYYTFFMELCLFNFPNLQICDIDLPWTPINMMTAPSLEFINVYSRFTQSFDQVACRDYSYQADAPHISESVRGIGIYDEFDKTISVSHEIESLHLDYIDPETVNSSHYNLRQFMAIIEVNNHHHEQFKIGDIPVINLVSSGLPSRIIEIKWKRNVTISREKIELPKYIAKGEEAEVVFEALKPFVCEDYDKFSCVDENGNLVFSGYVTNVYLLPNLKEICLRFPVDERFFEFDNKQLKRVHIKTDDMHGSLFKSMLEMFIPMETVQYVAIENTWNDSNHSIRSTVKALNSVFSELCPKKQTIKLRLVCFAPWNHYEMVEREMAKLIQTISVKTEHFAIIGKFHYFKPSYYGAYQPDDILKVNFLKYNPNLMIRYNVMQRSLEILGKYMKNVCILTFVIQNKNCNINGYREKWLMECNNCKQHEINELLLLSANTIVSIQPQI
eukprot:269741_1